MSDQDQEITNRLRRTYEAFSRGDFDTAFEIFHPQIEFVRAGGQSSIRGEDALRAWAEPDAFEELHIEPREFRVNGKRVLVRQHSRARGAGSGIEVVDDDWAVWTLDDDSLVTRVENFPVHQKNEALEAAGLSQK